MKIVIPAVLAVALASAAPAEPKASNNPQELVNLESAWSQAVVARDAAALNRIVAADWHGQNEMGKMSDRAAMLHQALTAADKLSAMVNHDVHVRFIGGDHAIVQGMDNETGMKNGHVVHKNYSWTDIFEKRDGHWLAIASQNTPLK